MWEITFFSMQVVGPRPWRQLLWRPAVPPRLRPDPGRAGQGDHKAPDLIRGFFVTAGTFKHVEVQEGGFDMGSAAGDRGLHPAAAVPLLQEGQVREFPKNKSQNYLNLFSPSFLSAIYTVQILVICLFFGYATTLASSVRFQVWEKESQNFQVIKRKSSFPHLLFEQKIIIIYKQTFF